MPSTLSMSMESRSTWPLRQTSANSLNCKYKLHEFAALHVKICLSIDGKDLKSNYFRSEHVLIKTCFVTPVATFLPDPFPLGKNKISEVLARKHTLK